MIVLDTHVWFFWTNDSISSLSKNALQAIETSDILGINIISCWEIAMLVVKGRIKLSLDVQTWINEALNYPKIKLLSIDPEIAVLATRLPGDFHGDPADRFIAACCMKHQLPLISKDKKIHDWGYVKTIW